MKKLLVAAFAAVLSVAFVVPASALENDFGGYWRTRAYTNQDFSGDDTESKDYTVVDTRTRLYYTAKLNDNLKFVNKFEFDATWGDDVLGDVGADGKNFEIKNSYADFNWMDINFKIGIQGLQLQRGFLFDNDHSGAHITYKAGAFTLPFVWAKVEEGYDNASGKDANDWDTDFYVLYPSYAINDNMVVKGLLGYMTEEERDMDLFFIGVDFDATFDALSVWFTGIYETGDITVAGSMDAHDVDALLLAVGGAYDFGSFDIHGQIFYATGDDDGTADGDIDSFGQTPGQSYYWAEIMGYGTFDAQVSNGSPADAISNIIAANIGTSFKPMDKLKLSADLWYAELDEDDANGEDDLGVEVDLKASYQLIEGLNLDVVAAYLFAGDATGDEDPYEIGTRLSLSF